MVILVFLGQACTGLSPSTGLIALGGLQRCPGSFLQEKGFASSIPGGSLTPHLDVHRPCSFSALERLHFCTSLALDAWDIRNLG